jgi:transcriptional regulator with XRE-family HTH domain
MNELGTYLKSRRLELGLSRERVAWRIDSTEGYVYKFEEGYIRSGPSLQYLEELAVALECDYDYLLELKAQVLNGGAGSIKREPHIPLIQNKLRLTLLQRGRALVLLRRGYTVDDACRTLQERYHPDRSVGNVKLAYFPLQGIHAIWVMEGKPHKEIAERFKRLAAWYQKAPVLSSERLMRQHLDPVFAARMRQRVSEALKDRWANHPEYCARMQRLAAEKSAERRLLRAISGCGKQSGWEDGRTVPTITPDYVSTVNEREIAREVHRAISSLPPVQQAIVAETFEIDIAWPQGVIDTVEAMSYDQRERELTSALTLLGMNQSLIDLNTRLDDSENISIR